MNFFYLIFTSMLCSFVTVYSMEQVLTDGDIRNIKTIMLFKAIQSNNYNSVVNALQMGANPNTFCKSGFTPLMYATSRFSVIPIVKLLLEKGANPLLKDKKGATALTYLLRGYVFFPCKKAGTDTYEEQLRVFNYQMVLLINYMEAWNKQLNSANLEKYGFEIVDK